MGVVCLSEDYTELKRKWKTVVLQRQGDAFAVFAVNTHAVKSLSKIYNMCYPYLQQNNMIPLYYIIPIVHHKKRSIYITIVLLCVPILYINSDRNFVIS